MRSKQWYTKASRSPNSRLNSSIGTSLYVQEGPVASRKIRRGSGQREISGKDFQLADEIRYIQRRAAAYDGRFVTVGPLALFSTDTGDAWLLDPADHLAARVARGGDPEPIHIEETEANFAIG